MTKEPQLMPNQQPTPAQAKAIEKITSYLRSHWNLHTTVEVAYKEEPRPGQGHPILWFACDGDRIAVGQLDRHGNGFTSVGDVDWLHTGTDDCECWVCATDDPEPDPDAEAGRVIVLDAGRAAFRTVNALLGGITGDDRTKVIEAIASPERSWWDAAHTIVSARGPGSTTLWQLLLNTTDYDVPVRYDDSPAPTSDQIRQALATLRSAEE